MPNKWTIDGQTWDEDKVPYNWAAIKLFKGYVWRYRLLEAMASAN
jgi:hypothetical protein